MFEEPYWIQFIVDQHSPDPLCRFPFLSGARCWEPHVPELLLYQCSGYDMFNAKIHSWGSCKAEESKRPPPSLSSGGVRVSFSRCDRCGSQLVFLTARPQLQGYGPVVIFHNPWKRVVA